MGLFESIMLGIGAATGLASTGMSVASAFDERKENKGHDPQGGNQFMQGAFAGQPEGGPQQQPMSFTIPQPNFMQPQQQQQPMYGAPMNPYM